MARSNAQQPGSPVCVVIAGPNGAGKTTFARQFLAGPSGVTHFVNADLIASGLSPFKPELAALRAGRMLLSELDRLAKMRESFAFESTLSGVTCVTRLRRSKPRDTNSRSSTYGLGHRSWLCAELLRECARVATMFRVRTWCADSSVARVTLKRSSASRQMRGRCTIILVPVRNS